LQDSYSVSLPGAGAAAPPGNVTPGSDGIQEATIYPDISGSGNFGLVSLTNSNVTSTAPYTNWIRNGPSAADLATFGPAGLQGTALLPGIVFGGPALKAPLTNDMAQAIGQPRVFPIVGPPLGVSPPVTYPVVGFTGGVVVSVDTNRNIVRAQLCPLIDLTATLGGGPSIGNTQFVYRGITLSR
jgi:hypothetical protein